MPAVPTFMHTFPGNAVRPASTQLAAMHGLNIYPVGIYDGRECIVIDQQRIARTYRGKPGAAHTSYSVKFLDTGSVENIPAGKFNRKVR